MRRESFFICKWNKFFRSIHFCLLGKSCYNNNRDESRWSNVCVFKRVSRDWRVLDSNADAYNIASFCEFRRRVKECCIYRSSVSRLLSASWNFFISKFTSGLGYLFVHTGIPAGHLSCFPSTLFTYRVPLTKRKIYEDFQLWSQLSATWSRKLAKFDVLSDASIMETTDSLRLYRLIDLNCRLKTLRNKFCSVW